MNADLVQTKIVDKYDRVYARDSGNKYPTTDLVRLESWFFNGEPGRLLEYGFGSGANLLHFFSRGYLIDGVEASKEAISLFESQMKKKLKGPSTLPTLHFIGPNHENLPFDSDQFDYLVCTSVLSLLGSREAVEKLIDEFVRVLKNGGKAIIDINSPGTEMAKGEYIGNDQFLQNNESDTGEDFIHYCPSEKVFKSILSNRLSVVDIGYSARDYFGRKSIELIACCSKSNSPII